MTFGSPQLRVGAGSLSLLHAEKSSDPGRPGGQPWEGDSPGPLLSAPLASWDPELSPPHFPSPQTLEGPGLGPQDPPSRVRPPEPPSWVGFLEPCAGGSQGSLVSTPVFSGASDTASQPSVALLPCCLSLIPRPGHVTAVLRDVQRVPGNLEQILQGSMALAPSPLFGPET